MTKFEIKLADKLFTNTLITDFNEIPRGNITGRKEFRYPAWGNEDLEKKYGPEIPHEEQFKVEFDPLINGIPFSQIQDSEKPTAIETETISKETKVITNYHFGRPQSIRFDKGLPKYRYMIS